MPIRTKVVRVEETPPDLRAPIAVAYREAFPNVNDDGVDDRGTEWADGMWRVLVWQGDIWGGIVEVLDRTIDVNGKAVRVGGVGGVMTTPMFRGRGLGKAAMQATVDFICGTLKADAGMLYCVEDMIPYYASLGWEDLQTPITYHQSDGARLMDTRRHKDGCAMIRSCGRFAFPVGPIDVRGKLW